MPADRLLSKESKWIEREKPVDISDYDSTESRRLPIQVDDLSPCDPFGWDFAETAFE